MNKKNIFSFIVITLLLVCSVNQVFATIWEELEPQEVVERADVIIVGKYDFSTKPSGSEKTMPFCGMKFHIDKVYKGKVSDQTTAGIDCYGLSMVEKFQQDGGRYLLFLEYGGKIGFSIPVGGPNGMVKLKNGEVQEEDEERKAFFEEFLEKKNDTNGSLLFYIIVSFIAGAALIVVWYFANKKRKSVLRGRHV